jgi:spore coat polysaccharide biosynthesis protein SpsF (cytidylyltransferase family)
MILAILQTRTSSTRLPDNALLPLEGAPMIARQIERISRARRLDTTIAWLPSANADDGEIRWTIDRPDHYVFVSEVHGGLYPGDPELTTADIRWLLGRRPDLARFGGDRRI